MRTPVLLLTLMLGALLVPAAQAQEEDPQRFLYNFEVELLDEPIQMVPLGQPVTVSFALHDRSQDDADAIGAPAGANPIIHRTSFEITALEGQREGWILTPPATLLTAAGDTVEDSIRVLPTPVLTEPRLLLEINATMRDSRTGIQVHNVFTLLFMTPGIDGFTATPRGSVDLEPRETAQMGVSINQLSLLPRTYTVEVLENPCNVRVVPFAGTTIPGREQRIVEFTVQAPEERFWYFTEDCSVAIGVSSTENPDLVRRVPLSIVVNGGYFNPVWAFWAVGILLAAVLLVLFVADRKARIEEELLGKPQKPWTIPVERVYLDHLKQRDPRAHYVVRHFLMEEEYASALLWYKEFKKATAGTRSKERIVVSQERRVERFHARWARKTERPVRKAERLEARLQKRLDRKARKGLRKQHARWRKITRKMQAAHEASVKKATEKWEKQAARAQKKDKPLPERPDFRQPDYPPEPTDARLMLADHRWNRKAERFRARQVKQQGNLEVRAEKREARLLRKVRRRVERVARKLDDPEFVAEHPLLGGRAAAESVRKQVGGSGPS